MEKLRQKANLFFKDRQLTEKWLDTPCQSFAGSTPREHFKSSEKAKAEVLGYIDVLIDRLA